MKLFLILQRVVMFFDSFLNFIFSRYGLLQFFRHPSLTIRSYLLSHFSKRFRNFFFSPYCLSRVGEVMMKALGAAGKVRTVFIGVIANCNNKIETKLCVFVNMITGVVRNINTVFEHGFNSARVYAMRFNSCAIY